MHRRVLIFYAKLKLIFIHKIQEITSFKYIHNCKQNKTKYKKLD